MKKIKKMPFWLYFNPKSVGKSRDSEKIKIIVPFHPYQTHNRKCKKIAKKFKRLKNSILASFQDKIGRKRLRKRENKKYRFVSSLPDA